MTFQRLCNKRFVFSPENVLYPCTLCVKLRFFFFFCLRLGSSFLQTTHTLHLLSASSLKCGILTFMRSSITAKTACDFSLRHIFQNPQYSEIRWLLLFQNGDVCISILHPPVDDPQSGELPSERWNPTQNVRSASPSSFSLLICIFYLILSIPCSVLPPLLQYFSWHRVLSHDIHYQYCLLQLFKIHPQKIFYVLYIFTLFLCIVLLARLSIHICITRVVFKKRHESYLFMMHRQFRWSLEHPILLIFF